MAGKKEASKERCSIPHKEAQANAVKSVQSAIDKIKRRKNAY